MRKYTFVFATDRHEKIRTLSELKAHRHHDPKLGLWLNGKAIGEGTLLPLGNKRSVHTEWTSLDKEHRRKGHGIHLYFALITAAKKIGATRIYSSTNLNARSRRMWSEKLRKFYDIREFKGRRKCRRCGCTNRRALQYYIVLRKKS